MSDAITGKKVRQRVTTACLGCRDKKTRCDGNPARCSACHYREQECIYLFTENKRKPPSKNYVKALEARIESLESQLALARTSLEQQLPRVSTVEVAPGPGLFSRSLPLTETPPQSLSVDPIDDVADTLGKFRIADGGEVRYFGSRSNFNLLQTAMASQKSSKEMRLEGYNATVTQLGSIDITDDLRNHLLDLFWRWQNPWQFIISPTLFNKSLADAGGGPFGQFHSPMLLASVYALAARYSDRLVFRTDPQDPNTAGDRFLAQVKHMLQYEMEAPTTTTVQTVLLLALSENGRDKESLGFLYCGMATRMALNLGLHVDCSRCIAEGLLTAEEVKDREVTWWGVYMLDKLFNIGLGRPSMVRESDITAKMPSLDSEDEYAHWQGLANDVVLQGTTPCHCVSLALSTREMFSAATETLDALYSPSNSLSNSARGDLVTTAHVRLVAFLNALPSHLQLPKSLPSSSTSIVPHVYQLHLQYHVVIILLHRPFLKTTRLQDGSIKTSCEDENLHSTACRGSAKWIVNILRWRGKEYKSRNMPISAVHCVFTAAIIFLADATAESQQVRNMSSRNLDFCISTLEEMEIAWAWSTRSLLALKNIAEAWKVNVPAFNKARYQTVAAPNDGYSQQDIHLSGQPQSPKPLSWPFEANETSATGLDFYSSLHPFAGANDLFSNLPVTGVPWSNTMCFQ